MHDFSKAQPWWAIQVYKDLALQLKQEVAIPDYVFKISSNTADYEKKIRELWDEFKENPTKENAERFAEYMKEYSRELWYDSLLDILGVDELTEKQQELLDEKLAEHHNYIEGSLLPDIIKGIDKELDSFDNFDYRVIFLYAGALWAFGFLGTIMFDGLSIRDLADLFIFVGPNDENTCVGERGCQKHVGKIYTVAEILARNIIPGNFKCLTNCRHILLPVMSPLGE